MRVVAGLCVAILLAAVIFAVGDYNGFVVWVTDAQREFQNHMAGAVRALRAGEPGALFALCSATAAYGFVHALGPGHGKYLIGGVGLGSSISSARLTLLATASSVLQSLWAILLVYGGFFLVDFTADNVTWIAEDILARISYVAIGCVGLLLVWKGYRTLLTANSKHADTECGCHSHGPSIEQAARVLSFRPAAALVVSIAIRPCTGAIFLLVIAWHMDIHFAGALSVVVMGLGTSLLTTCVALASVATRRFSVALITPRHDIYAVFSILQIVCGALIALMSIGLLRAIA